MAILSATTLLAMSEMALAGDRTADLTPAQAGNGASQALMKKMDAMEQRIKSLEAQLKQKDTPPSRSKTAAESGSDGKSRTQMGKALDLADAAPAGGSAAQTPPSGQAPPVGRTASPDQPVDFKSPSMATDEEFVQTFAAPGTYKYFC